MSELSTEDKKTPSRVESPQPEMTEAEAEYHAKATTRPKEHIFVDGETKALQTFNIEIEKSRQSRALAKAETLHSARSDNSTPSSYPLSVAEPEGSHADNPIIVQNIYSTPQLLTFKIPKLPAMKDVFLMLDMGKLPTSLAVLPASFEPDADVIGPRANHLGNLAPSAASASLRLYMSDQYHQRAADYRWQEEMQAPSARHSATATEAEPTGPVQSKLLGPKLAAMHKSFALPFGKELGYTGDTTENLSTTPVMALQKLTGNFYFAVYSSVPLANVEILCRVNQSKLKEEDDIRHPWRIARMFTVNPFSHDAFVDWFNKNKTALTLGATSLVEPNTNMNPLHVAMGYVADPRIVKLMIKHCGKFIKLNATDNEGQSPIFKMLQRADIYHPSSRLYYRALELLKLVAVDAGCYLDLQDNYGNTLAHYAARHHRVGSQILPKLLEFGAQGDMKNNEGRTPVEEADHYGGNVDDKSKTVIPRKLPLDLREIKQLLAAAEESRRRLRNEEMQGITGQTVDEIQTSSCTNIPPVEIQQPILKIEPTEEAYPTSTLLKLKAEREAKGAKVTAQMHPAPGPDDAQIHMGMMRSVPEADKRTIRTQWSMPRPLMAVGLNDEGAPKQFPTPLVEAADNKQVPEGTDGVRLSTTTTSARDTLQGELYEPPTSDSAALFVPFPSRVANSEGTSATADKDGTTLGEDIIATSFASALDQEVRVLNRKRLGETELQPSYTKKKSSMQATAKHLAPAFSTVPPPARTYQSYVTEALNRATKQLSYKSSEIKTESSYSPLKLPPIEEHHQSRLLGSLLQKRKDAETGRTLEECVARDQTRLRNLANKRNEGSINIPSFAEVRSYAESKKQSQRLRTGKGLPMNFCDDGELEDAIDGDAHRNINPDLATIGGFRGSFGLVGESSRVADKIMSRSGSPRTDTIKSRDTAILDNSEGRSHRQNISIEQADEASYRMRTAVENLNDASVIPLEKLLILQKEFNELEKKEGRGYLTVGQVTTLVKGFDSFGVPRSDSEIEELVRLGGLKRVYRHRLRATAAETKSLVPIDGITFNDYCAIMLSLNRL